jgi:hypothetical protein
MRNNIGWLLLGGALAIATYSSIYNLILFSKIEDLNRQLLSVEFDQDICNRRVM